MITPENKERIRRKVRGIIAYRRENGMTKEMIWAVLVSVLRRKIGMVKSMRKLAYMLAIGWKKNVNGNTMRLGLIIECLLV
jgi:hypothetical protein